MKVAARSCRNIRLGGIGLFLPGFVLLITNGCASDPVQFEPLVNEDNEGDGFGEDGGAPDASPAPPADAGGARANSPVPGKVVTYAFGVKNARYAAGYHTGEDYSAPIGTPIVAVRNGIIRWSNDNGGAYGKWLGLEAENGRTYVYCHLSLRSVTVGDQVIANQELGKVGATGNVTGPHLHFEDHPVGKFVYGQVRKPAW